LTYGLIKVGCPPSAITNSSDHASDKEDASGEGDEAH
jgi:hypothetical protein